MDISVYCDTVSPAPSAKQALGLGFSKFLIRRHLNNTDGQSPTSLLQIDAMARPPVKARPRKAGIRKRRRTRRILAGGDDDGDGVDGGGIEGFEGGGEGGGGGSYGGNFGGGWGKRWDFYGGENWGEDRGDDSWGLSGFASDFIYEVLCWIALSNCVHFTFKRFVRSVTDGGIGDAEQGKVPGSVC